MPGNDWRYCIPSKQRAGKLTAGILEALGERVVVFVDDEDADIYKGEYPKLDVVPVGFSNKGITPVRHFIVNWAIGEKLDAIVMADDDIRQFRQRADWRGDYWGTEPLEDVAGAIDSAIARMAELNWAQLGFGFVASAVFVRQPIKLFQQCSDCYALNVGLLAGANVNYDTKASHFEDYDLTAQIITRGMGTGRLFTLMFEKPTMNADPGGCACYDRQAQATASAKHLVRKWGGERVRVFYSERHDMSEVKFTWQKFRPASEA